MSYYSVDRRGVYAEGKKITLEPNLDPSENEIVAHINKMYPEGFSRHGVTYYRDPLFNPTPADNLSGVLELLLEAARKAHYPEKPTRFQSMFASEALSEAQQFREKYGKPSDPIYELHPEGSIHRADMRLLTLSDSFACIDHRLHLYWQGTTLKGLEPLWEFVVALPVRVGKKVA